MGPATAAATRAIAQLQAAGAVVRVVQADVAQAQDVAHLLDVCQKAAPLRGIVHAAGVLDDGVLARQNAERLVRVLWTSDLCLQRGESNGIDVLYLRVRVGWFTKVEAIPQEAWYLLGPSHGRCHG